MTDNERTPERILTPKEVGARLKVSDDLVRSLCARGVLRARRVGALWRIPESALVEFFAAREVERPQSGLDADIHGGAPQRSKRTRAEILAALNGESPAEMAEKRRSARQIPKTQAKAGVRAKSKKSREP